MFPAAKFFDRRWWNKSPQRVDPFCMASVTEDTSCGYLKEDCFTLRLELRIKHPDNESATFAILRRMVFCEVSAEKALLVAKSGRCQWNIKHAWEMSPSVLRTDHFKINNDM